MLRSFNSTLMADSFDRSIVSRDIGRGLMIMATSRERILLLTANQESRETLLKGLTEMGYEVTVVPNEAAMMEAMGQATPSLLVADRQACRFEKLRQHKTVRMIPIIALEDPDQRCSEEECIEDLDRGVDLVLCQQTTRELIARVRAVLRRKDAQTKPTVHCLAGGIYMDLDRHEVTVNGKPVELTPKEFQILRSFLESPSRVFSRQEMLNCVWGEGYALEEHALDVHIHSLRQKIEENPAKPKLIVTVRGIGYKLRPGS